MLFAVTFLATAVTGFCCDLNRRRIPNGLLLFSAVCGLTLAWGQRGLSGLYSFLACCFQGGIPIFLLFCLGVFGAGDGKLLMLLAGYMGVRACLEVLLWSLVLAAGYGLLKMKRERCLARSLTELFLCIRRKGVRGTVLIYVQGRKGKKICFSGFILAGLAVRIFCHGGGII